MIQWKKKSQPRILRKERTKLNSKQDRERDKNKKLILKVLLCSLVVMVLLLPLVFSRSLTPLSSKDGIKKYAAAHYGEVEVNNVIKEKDSRTYTVTDKEGMFEYEITSYRTNELEEGKFSPFWKEFKTDTFLTNYSKYIEQEIVKQYPVRILDGEVLLKLTSHDNITAANVSSEITRLDTRNYFANLRVYIQNEEGKKLGAYVREEREYFTMESLEKYDQQTFFMGLAKEAAKKDVVFVKTEIVDVEKLPGIKNYEFVAEKDKCTLYYYECEGKQYYRILCTISMTK